VSVVQHLERVQVCECVSSGSTEAALGARVGAVHLRVRHLQDLAA